MLLTEESGVTIILFGRICKLLLDNKLLIYGWQVHICSHIDISVWRVLIYYIIILGSQKICNIYFIHCY